MDTRTLADDDQRTQAASEVPFAFSVDVEEYFQVQAFAGIVSRDGWESWPSRVEESTRRILDILDEAGGKGTFFTLGWVARKRPALVKEIASRGHEVASHGMFHQMLTELTPESFRMDARDSRAVLEDVAAAPVNGFRAPSYSVNQSTLWAIDVLAETGYQYDSSVFPIRRRRYGYPKGPTRPGILRGARHSIAEFPLPTMGIGPLRVPVLAGAYLRLLPSAISLHAARHHLARRLPLVVNIHPWEIDPGQPTVGPRRAPWTHYARLGHAESILRRVLACATFRSVATRLRELGLLGPADARERGGAR